jgi:maltose O-acetyltransferase
MLLFLWKNRQRHSLMSRAGVKAWAKRLRTVPDLLRRSVRVARLRAAGATIGEGVLISPCHFGGCENVSIGDNSFIGRIHAQAIAPITIGSNVCINDGVQLLTASHDLQDPKWATRAAPIVIDDYAWIATGAIILPGVTVGRGAVVGAGAVVTRDVPEGALAVGNPVSVRCGKRAAELNYNPNRFVALFEAWLGREVS